MEEYGLAARRPASARTLLAWMGAAAPRLFTTSAFLLAARLLGAAAGFAIQLLLARWLSPHDLGLYFAATSFAAVGGVLAAHGYPSIAARFVSRYREPRTASMLRAFVRHAQAESLLLALGIAAATLCLAAAWPGFDRETRTALSLAALTVPFCAGFRLYGALATARRRFALAYLPDVCLRPLVMLAALLAMLAAGHGIALLDSLEVLVAATMLLAAAQYLILRRDFPVELGLRTRPPRPAARSLRPLAAKWRREAHAVLLVAVFSQFFADVSILIATPVLSAAEMGVFGVALKLAFLIGFFVLLTQNIATPDLADALARRAERREAPAIADSCSAATLVTCVALLLCAFGGRQVLAVFGADFAAGHTALVLLVAAQLVRAVFGPSNTVLTLVGEQKANLGVTAFAVLVLAASTALLGSLYGVDGAALAVLLTTLVWSGGSAWLLHRRAGVRVDLLGAYARPA